MSAATPTIDELLEHFRFLEDWEDRYIYLIELGRKLEPMDEAAMNPQTLVKGCQATVYLTAELSNDEPPVMTFNATANAAIVCGLIVVLQGMFCARTPAEILAIDAIDLARKLGFEEHLSSTRRNGLHAMITRIKSIATEYAAAA